MDQKYQIEKVIGKRNKDKKIEYFVKFSKKDTFGWYQLELLKNHLSLINEYEAGIMSGEVDLTRQYDELQIDLFDNEEIMIDDDEQLKVEEEEQRRPKQQQQQQQQQQQKNVVDLTDGLLEVRKKVRICDI